MLSPNFAALEDLEVKVRALSKRILLIGLFLSSLTASIVIFLFWKRLLMFSPSFPEMKYMVIVIIFIIFLIIFYVLKDVLQSNFEIKSFRQFAKDNEFTFSEIPDTKLKHAHFFSFGDTQKFSFSIESANEQLPFSFFDFEYTVTRRGKYSSRETFPFVIFVFHLPKALPNIYIHNKNNDSTDEIFTEDQRLKITMRQDEEKAVTIYTPKEDAEEVTRFLDQDFMNKVYEIADGYDIEFYDSKMFIYIPYEYSTNITTTKDLFTLYNSLNQMLIKKVETIPVKQKADTHYQFLKKDPFNFFEINTKQLKITLTLILVSFIVFYLSRLYLAPLFEIKY